jgi:hypothetical protein
MAKLINFRGLTVKKVFSLLLVSFLIIVFSSKITEATLVSPTITSITGTTFPNAGSTCYNQIYQGYFLVRYKNYNYVPIILYGSNLNLIVSVDSNSQMYSATISNKTATKFTLNITGNYQTLPSNEYPRPAKDFRVTFRYKRSDNTYHTLDYVIRPGIMPTYNKTYDYCAWGQNIWYAGYIMRIRNSKSVVNLYSQTYALSANPSNSGFPKINSVLNCSDFFLSYLENMTLKSSVTNTDGSITFTYKLSGSYYNKECTNTISHFYDALFVTKKSKSGVYSIIQVPNVPYALTKVRH